MTVPPLQMMDGVVLLNEEWSVRERQTLSGMIDLLQQQGFQWLSIPSIVETDTFVRQEMVVDGRAIMGWSLGQEQHLRLAGSAEQGILQRYRDQQTTPHRIVACNQCFRPEQTFDGLKYLREFNKVEQFAFCEPPQRSSTFEELLQYATAYVQQLGITRWRHVDCSNDPGYHQQKTDIEVWTQAYGWLETHSCTDYGLQQTSRYNIAGVDGTPLASVSCTGVASPRILVPLMEQAGIDVVAYC